MSPRTFAEIKKQRPVMCPRCGSNARSHVVSLTARRTTGFFVNPFGVRLDQSPTCACRTIALCECCAVQAFEAAAATLGTDVDSSEAGAAA